MKRFGDSCIKYLQVQEKKASKMMLSLSVPNIMEFGAIYRDGKTESTCFGEKGHGFGLGQLQMSVTQRDWVTHFGIRGSILV